MSLRYPTLAIFSLALGFSQAQKQEHIPPDHVIQVEFLGETAPYRDWDRDHEFPNEKVRDERGLLIKRDSPPGAKEARLHQRVNPKALPLGEDQAWQREDGRWSDATRALDLTINGQGNTGVNPADPCLDVGPNHVIQMINGSSGSYFRVYDKSGNPLGAQTYLDNFIGSVGGAGDPIVLYDALADRWLMSEFAATGNRLLVAVSSSPDPAGTWFSYSFTTPNFPDYPKYGVWNGLYIVTTNEASPTIYALDRDRMLLGQTATAQRFTVPSYPTIGFQACTPVTHDGGAAPPANAPAMFMRMADDAWSVNIPNDRLEIWTMNINWVTPANSSINGPTFLATQPFDTELCGYTSFSCIQQPGTTTRLDPLREVLMNRIQYRNFGAYEAIVCNHATDVSGNDRAGVRWYELRRTAVANPWNIHQQGTWSPDANSRWMGAIAINAAGDIGLAYNVSSTTVFPSIRYTGRTINDPLGQMTIAETSIVAGTSRNGSNRYGDYNSLDVDPSTDSFWGTAKFNTALQWSTRIFQFSVTAPLCSNPTATAQAQCLSTTTFGTVVNIQSMGSAFTLEITIDPDGPGPQPPVTVGSATGPGTYGPYGNYPTGTPVTVKLIHDLFSECDLTLPPVDATCIFPGSECGDFSISPGIPTVDLTTISSQLTVPSQGGLALADLRVFVDITHTWSADLRITLESPSGTIVGLLTTGVCGNADDLMVEFDDNGQNGPIGSVCPAVGVYAIPSTPLAVLQNELFEGVWTLRVTDVANQDQGILNSWCLIPTLQPPVCVPPTVSATGQCTPQGDFQVSVDITDMGDAGELIVRIDPDGPGPALFAEVAAVTTTGNYGPFGPFPSGQGIFIEVDHDVSTICDLSFFGGLNCNEPGDGCGTWSAAPDLPILDNATVSSTLTVPPLNEASIVDLNVYIDLDHAWVGDLRLTLESPAGTSVDLIASGKCGNAQDLRVEFDDSGIDGFIGVVCPLTDLFAIPDEDLSAFIGEPLEGTWTLSITDVFPEDNGVLNSWCLIPILDVPQVTVAPRVFLEGPYNSGSGLMSDALRSSGLIPAQEPFTGLGYVHSGGGGGETIAAGVLDITGNDAIVDWVLVELRDAGNSSTLVASRSALVQRDGDVVDMDGTSPVSFQQATGPYFLAIKHRNHLGVMATPAVTLNGAPVTVDLTLTTTGTFGLQARKSIGGVAVLWAGDATRDGQVKYTGAGNDRDPVLVLVGGQTPTATVNGYHGEDVNLDGVVKYTGAANDRDPILQNVGGSVPSAVRDQQLP